MTKRKDERRELLKEDEFLSILEQAARYIQQEPKKILGTTVAVIAVMALFFGWLAFQEEKRDKSAQSLYTIEKMLAAPVGEEDDEFKFETAEEKFAKVDEELTRFIQENSGVVKEQAMVYKIGTLINLGRQDELEALYLQLIKKSRGMRFMGIYGLADLYLSQEKYEQALEQYNRLLNLGGGTPDLGELVKFKMAACYHKKGDLPSAKQELSNLMLKYEDQDNSKQHPIYTQAKQLLEEIEKESPAAEEAS